MNGLITIMSRVGEEEAAPRSCRASLAHALLARSLFLGQVIACPCALIILTPVTYVAGLAVLAQKGVIVKGGQHLESLGQDGNIAFDKTGETKCLLPCSYP